VVGAVAGAMVAVASVAVATVIETAMAADLPILATAIQAWTR